MQSRECPHAAALRRQFKHDAACVRAARFGGAVNVAGRVESYAGHRQPSIGGSAGKVVDDGFRPGATGLGREFVDSPLVVSPADEGCAVEVAGSVEGDAARNLDAVSAGSKAVHNLLRPAAAGLGGKLEHGAATFFAGAVGASIGGGSVEISGGVEDHLGVRKDSIAGSAEAMDHGFRPATAPSLEKVRRPCLSR